MSESVQAVQNGTVTQTQSTSSTSALTNSSLGKDAFLQLLVTQMKYQDPLNPNTDTEFVAQLATFSQLEQMQNLTQTTTNSQAFSLVGKNVVVKNVATSGEITYKEGTVDFVSVSNGKVQLSIDGNKYNMDQLERVVDSLYLLQQGAPSIDEKINLDFDKSAPADISFEANMGTGDTVATDVAIVINGEVVATEYVSVDKNKITISKEALADLEVGSYKATIVFNDSLYTTIADKLTINVKNPEPEVA
ncbi:MAG: flagellar hook capping protein [Lachnospiraceae bacterium]|jgi:flagellar basal-body rod modification protein FlgD|nr:flagellar hook capping protein [Lachnospiraceae bacterium]